MIDRTTQIVIVCMMLTLTIGVGIEAGPFYLANGDSMEPTVHTPAITHCEPVDNPAELEPGDIIAYEYMGGQSFHRVAENPGPVGDNTLTATRDNPAYQADDIVQHDDVMCEVNGHVTLDPRQWV